MCWIQSSNEKTLFELEIETLKNASRDEGKLGELLKLGKRRMSKKQVTLKTPKG
jgi:hypothetical protein